MCQISRLLLWKSPQECQNVTIEFCFIMLIFYELRYTVIIEIVWTFYLKSVPAKFQKYLEQISWVISGTSSSKLSCNPRHPSRNISCNHLHNLLQPSWRQIFSTSNNQKTKVDSDINSDYKASSFDRLYIRRRKWDTAGFVRAHQRKYWNALTVSRGHADDGCSCNHRAVPPSDWGCLNLGLCAAGWAHFMCHHKLWPTSASRPFSFLNSSLGLAEGKHYQKITIPIFRLVLQNFAIPSYFPSILFYCYLFSLLSSGWVVIAVCDSISVQETS